MKTRTFSKKTSKKTLRNKFIRGSLYNAYKNSKNIERDPQENVFSGVPSIIPIKTQKTYITSSVTTFYYLQKLQKYRTNSVFMVEN